MTRTYEKRFESSKEHLLGIFRMEIARITDIYTSNKNTLDKLQTLNDSKLKMLIQQELHMAGIESEFMLKRVPPVKFGNQLLNNSPEDIEADIFNKDLSSRSKSTTENFNSSSSESKRSKRHVTRKSEKHHNNK